MGRTYDEIEPALADWLAAQRVFFVATAPSGNGGHVNLSPKGYDSFRVLEARRVAYLDLTGSGAETIAHLRDNGRITLMFCAFEGPPRIVRLYGAGRVHLVGTPEFDALIEEFGPRLGARSVIEVAVDRISSSCGYAVPFMDYVGERDTLSEWAERRGAEGIVAYHGEKNRHSIDGLPALEGTVAVADSESGAS